MFVCVCERESVCVCGGGGGGGAGQDGQAVLWDCKVSGGEGEEDYAICDAGEQFRAHVNPHKPTHSHTPHSPAGFTHHHQRHGIGIDSLAVQRPLRVFYPRREDLGPAYPSTCKRRPLYLHSLGHGNNRTICSYHTTPHSLGYVHGMDHTSDVNKPIHTHHSINIIRNNDNNNDNNNRRTPQRARWPWGRRPCRSVSSSPSPFTQGAVLWFGDVGMFCLGLGLFVWSFICMYVCMYVCMYRSRMRGLGMLVSVLVWLFTYMYVYIYPRCRALVWSAWHVLVWLFTYICMFGNVGM
jgi:hypothetical protein